MRERERSKKEENHVFPFIHAFRLPFIFGCCLCFRRRRRRHQVGGSFSCTLSVCRYIELKLPLNQIFGISLYNLNTLGYLN